MNAWWNADDRIHIYTNKTKIAEKLPIHYKCLMATYNDSKGKLFAYQYSVEEGSEEWRLIADSIELSNKDEIKEKRERKKKGE